jgi:hypothetical protein
VEQELAKCMDGATTAAFKEMQRLLKFVFDTQKYGLKIEPKFSEKDHWYVKL